MFYKYYYNLSINHEQRVNKNTPTTIVGVCRADDDSRCARTHTLNAIILLSYTRAHSRAHARTHTYENTHTDSRRARTNTHHPPTRPPTRRGGSALLLSCFYARALQHRDIITAQYRVAMAKIANVENTIARVLHTRRSTGPRGHACVTRV